jgi:hypothetical protein
MLIARSGYCAIWNRVDPTIGNWPAKKSRSESTAPKRVPRGKRGFSMGSLFHPFSLFWEDLAGWATRLDLSSKK